MKSLSFLRSNAAAAVLAATFGLTSCSPPAEAPKPAASVAAVPAADTALGAAAFTEVVADFKTALANGDHLAMISLSMPPTLLKQVRQQANVPASVTDDQIRTQSATAAQKAMAEASIVEVIIDPMGVEILKSTTGREHALVPSFVVMDIQGKRIRSSNNYLAMVDGERWFLLNPSNDNAIRVIKTAYPDLAELALNAPTMEVISQ